MSHARLISEIKYKFYNIMRLLAPNIEKYYQKTITGQPNGPDQRCNLRQPILIPITTLTNPVLGGKRINYQYWKLQPKGLK